MKDAIRLLVPANQLGPILQGVANAAKNIGEQIQFKADDDGGEVTKTSKKPVPKKRLASK